LRVFDKRVGMATAVGGCRLFGVHSRKAEKWAGDVLQNLALRDS
jgi:hypothetical protein